MESSFLSFRFPRQYTLSTLHKNKNLVLQSLQKVDLTTTFKSTHSDEMFYSSNACIMSDNLRNPTYYVGIRFINYKYLEGDYELERYKKLDPRFFSYAVPNSLHATLTLNKNLLEISPRKLASNLLKPATANLGYLYHGVEDVRFFNFNNDIYFLGVAFNPLTKKMGVVADKLQTLADWCTSPDYILPKKIITPDFVNTVVVEKNWIYVKYKDKLCVIHSWYPTISICEINFTTQRLKRLEHRSVPFYFHNARGSTCGVSFENEIWFILHKKDKQDYTHFLAVFDNQMHLLRYSHEFKFAGRPIEFCMGFLVEADRVIVSYSVLDQHTFVAAYDLTYIRKGLTWITTK